MKFLLFLSCAFVFANALDKALVNELLEKVQEYGIECAEEEKTPPEDIEALVNKLPPSTHEGKCTIFCVLKKMTIMNEDGTFGPGYEEWLTKVKADDPEFYEAMMSVYQICEDKITVQEDGCENAFALAECVRIEGTKKGLAKVFDE